MAYKYKKIKLKDNSTIKENNMTEEEAFAIIYELAEQNALDPDNCEYDLQGEAQLQQEALNIGRKMLS